MGNCCSRRQARLDRAESGPKFESVDEDGYHSENSAPGPSDVTPSPSDVSPGPSDVPIELEGDLDELTVVVEQLRQVVIAIGEGSDELRQETEGEGRRFLDEIKEIWPERRDVPIEMRGVFTELRQLMIILEAILDEQSPPTFTDEPSPPTFTDEPSPPTFTDEQSPPTFTDEQSPPTFTDEPSPPTFTAEQSPPTFTDEQSPATFTEELTQFLDELPQTVETVRHMLIQFEGDSVEIAGSTDEMKQTLVELNKMLPSPSLIPIELKESYVELKELMSVLKGVVDEQSPPTSIDEQSPPTSISSPTYSSDEPSPPTSIAEHRDAQAEHRDAQAEHRDAQADDDDHVDHDYAKVTYHTSTSLTLTCSAVSNLSYCFRKAHQVQPGVKELSLIGISFSQPNPVSVVTKNETLKILKIRAEKGNVQHVLHAVAEHCPALTKLDLSFDGEDYPIEMPHRRSSTWSICRSLRVLELAVGQLTLKDLISVMDVVSALYPNIQHLTINVKDKYLSDEKCSIGSVSLHLHHLEDLRFSSTGMDPKAEKDVQLTVHVYCPKLAPEISQDGVYIFRRIYGVSGYLDHLGGELSIPVHNVKLSIPPGALEDGEMISIDIFTELPNGINLQDNEIAASFGFRCFPSGSSFKKPLTLSMPHCAVIDDNEVVGMVLHFGNDDKGDVRRISLESNSYVIHADRIELRLDHFSWGIPTMIYNWLFPGEKSESRATKRMLSTPFIPQTLPEDQDCPILHVRFYNQLPGLPEEILAEEKSVNYKKIYPEEELIVKEDSVDMSISCKSEELPSTQTKVTAKKLMQRTKLTESLTLLQRRSLVTLIITQEHEIIMKFWTDIKDEKSIFHRSISEAPPSVGEVEEMITPLQSLSLREIPLRFPHTGYSHEESPGALVQYVPTEKIEARSTQRGAFRDQRRLDDLDPGYLTDIELVDLSRKLPLNKFNPISIRLGSTMTETENIRDSSNKAEEMYFTVLTRWKERTTAPRRQLIDVLREVQLIGIAQSMGLEHDSPQEDVEMFC